MKITEITTWSYSLHVVIFHLYIIASERMVIIMKPDYIVFPDASVKLSGKKRYGGYGVVVLERKSKQYLTEQNELHGKTVPYLEGYAMYRGLQLVSRFHKGNDARFWLYLTVKPSSMRLIFGCIDPGICQIIKTGKNETVHLYRTRSYTG